MQIFVEVLILIIQSSTLPLLANYIFETFNYVIHTLITLATVDALKTIEIVHNQLYQYTEKN